MIDLIIRGMSAPLYLMTYLIIWNLSYWIRLEFMDAGCTGTMCFFIKLYNFTYQFNHHMQQITESESQN